MGPLALLQKPNETLDKKTIKQKIIKNNGRYFSNGSDDDEGGGPNMLGLLAYPDRGGPC